MRNTRPFFTLPPSIQHTQFSLPALAFSLAVCTTSNEAHALGVSNSLLQDCQQNVLACVSSQDDTPSVFLEPWEYDDTSIDELKSRLLNVILSEPHARLVEQSSNYMRFELPSDDLEFFFPPDDHIVHFRSARRGSGFDFMQNRKRVERIRRKAGLTSITVLRGRQSPLKIFETPFDRFAPSDVDADAVIDYGGLGSKPMR